MNYLPSKKFVKQAFFVSLILLGWFSYSAITQSIGNALAKQEESGTLIFMNKAEPGIDGNLSLQRITSWENTAGVGVSDIIQDKPSFEGLTFNNFATANKLNQTKENTSKVRSEITTSLVSTFKKVLPKDLNISGDSSKNTLENYGKTLATALKPYSLPNLPNEAVSALNYLDSQDQTELEKIKIMAEIHKVVADTLLKMTVPEIAGIEHSILINTVNNLSSLDNIMTESITDPKIVATAVKELINEKNLLMTSFSNINQVFEKEKIVFKKADKMKVYVNNAQ